jgi:hypothetical protein
MKVQGWISITRSCSSSLVWTLLSISIGIGCFPLACVAIYANVTLSSLDGNLSVVVYLPEGLVPDLPVYYTGSRFDHSSMIGSIIRKVNGRSHVLYGTGLWRIPHNSNWPESGVGLAAEFGVGDDGDFCNFRCGWLDAHEVTNGVLGYREARNGETFLKIGVGELVKGSCPACDSTEDYNFNSPYLFAKRPYWTMTKTATNGVMLEHFATLRDHGYRLVKEVSLVGNTLSVTSTLTNMGAEHFSTVWYSHHFYTCDDVAIGPGYELDVNMKGDRNPIYEEPGTWSWSKPLRDYATVKGVADKISIHMTKALDPGIRIKTEFINDGTTTGGFTLKGCESSITATIPQVGGDQGIPMYAYNLYVERGTFSPEPQIYLSLDPGASKTWTQTLVINENLPPPPSSRPITSLFDMSLTSSLSNIPNTVDLTTESSSDYTRQSLLQWFAILSLSMVVMFTFPWRNRRRTQYQLIPESDSPL